jgi:hypothetical protein
MTAEQRSMLEERRRCAEALKATFGALPNLEVPSRGEWLTAQSEEGSASTDP